MKRQLPKNVRQIGNVSDSSKIYVEDYVDTFFNQLCEKAETEMAGAFLVGEIVQEEEQDYIYVYGAIKMKELEMKGKDFVISDQVWKHACETCKQYFEEAEILGWFIAGGQTVDISHSLTKLHQKYFPREKSLFVVKNARDKEERFYIYKFKSLMEISGHYVYYEKNLEMQNYMIASRKKIGFTPSEIIEDRVTKNFRSIIREKEEKNAQKKRFSPVYVISTFLVLVILVIGVNMINNYEKMREAQEVLDDMREKEDETIEVSGGNVITQQENEQKEEKQEEEGKEEAGHGDATEMTESESAEGENVEEKVEEEVLESEPETYIVQKGDTLESISKQKYGSVLRVSDICALNKLEDGNLIFIGQKLLLP